MSEIQSAEFRVKEEYFWWRVASLTSLPVCFLATARYGFTCFDHWFSGHHVIVLDDSGKGRVVSLRYDKKKVWLTRILTYLVSRSFQNPVLITLRCKVVSFCCDDEGCLLRCDHTNRDYYVTQIITVFLKQMTLLLLTLLMAWLRNEKMFK